MSIEIGKKAPEFELPCSDGTIVSLSACENKKVVLYFYPKDDTPGCTKQAIAFTDMKKAFDAANTLIFGVSKDSITKHEKFTAKHELGIPLISDENSNLCESYGVWVEKSMYGKTYMGIERSTFLIDTNGAVAQMWRKVKVPGHVEEVLKAAQNL